MVDMHLEVDVIPVSDVERSKEFYGRLGWRLDDDVAPAMEVRIVQFTPPGSGCSVTFGKGITPAALGSAMGTLVVSDIVAAHKDVAAAASTQATCGMALRSLQRHVSKAPTPNTRVTDLSSPSAIPTIMCGSSRRSRRGVLAEPDRAIASRRSPA